jgi:hypothetical protein
VILALGLLGHSHTPLAHAAAPATSANNQCPQGLVSRQLTPRDHLCVTPAIRDALSGLTARIRQTRITERTGVLPPLPQGLTQPSGQNISLSTAAPLPAPTPQCPKGTQFDGLSNCWGYAICPNGTDDYNLSTIGTIYGDVLTGFFGCCPPGQVALSTVFTGASSSTCAVMSIQTLAPGYQGGFLLGPGDNVPASPPPGTLRQPAVMPVCTPPSHLQISSEGILIYAPYGSVDPTTWIPVPGNLTCPAQSHPSCPRGYTFAPGIYPFQPGVCQFGTVLSPNLER